MQELELAGSDLQLQKAPVLACRVDVLIVGATDDNDEATSKKHCVKNLRCFLISRSF